MPSTAPSSSARARTAAEAPVRFASIGSGVYPVLAAVMAVTLILSNIGAAKGVEIGIPMPWDPDFTLITDGAFFLFPFAYIVGDVISEVYGFRASRRAIITSFALSVFAAGCYWLFIALPGASWYDGQEALERTLGPVWLIVVASLLGFLVGQLANAFVMTRMKRRSGERLLFGRIAASTLVGEFLDTLIFCSIAAGVIGVETAGQFVNYLAVGVFWKVLVELVFSPVTMAVIALFKRGESSYGEVPSA